MKPLHGMKVVAHRSYGCWKHSKVLQSISNRLIQRFIHLRIPLRRVNAGGVIRVGTMTTGIVVPTEGLQFGQVGVEILRGYPVPEARSLPVVGIVVWRGILL